MRNLLFVVTHKKDYFIPKLEMYKSIAVGPNKNQIESDYRDDKNIEISNKNPNYCELTAQYWIWKNLNGKYDNYGLCHYRRYFANSVLHRFSILKENRLNSLLNIYDIILPKQWYWNIKVKEMYYDVGQGKKKDLEMTREAIKNLYPEYLGDFDKIVNDKKASYCNMFITNHKNFENYSEWLFNVLSYVEHRTDLTDYTVAEARIYGYLSEILLNVWVEHNNLRVKYLPMVEIEQSKSAQLKNDIIYLKRKVLPKD